MPENTLSIIPHLYQRRLHDDPSGQLEPPVDLDLGYSAILSGQEVGTVTADQLPELLKLSEWDLLTDQLNHPVELFMQLLVQKRHLARECPDRCCYAAAF